VKGSPRDPIFCDIISGGGGVVNDKCPEKDEHLETGRDGVNKRSLLLPAPMFSWFSECVDPMELDLIFLFKYCSSSKVTSL